MPLPFLNLPYNLHDEILRMLPFFEIVEFGALSKRSAILVRKHISTRDGVPKEAPALELLNNEPIVGLGSLQRGYTDNRRKNGEEARMFGSGMNVMRLYKYSLDPLKDWMKMVDALLYITGRKITSFSISLDAIRPLWPNRVRGIVRWLKSKTRSVKCLLIFGPTASEADVLFILRNLRCKRSLSLDHPVANDDMLSLIPNNLLRLVLNGGINLEQFLRLDAIEIKILSRRNRLSVQDVNIFLRSWRAGNCHERLEQLELIVQPENRMSEFLVGIPSTVASPIRVLLRPFDDPIRGGVDIKKRDGTVATLYVRMDPLGYWKLGMWIVKPEDQ